MQQVTTVPAQRPAPAPRPGAATPEDKLALTELLLASEEAEEGAQHCLDWLGKHLGVKRGLCAAVDGEGGRLVALAAYGMPVPSADEWTVELDERDHPLVTALSQVEPAPLSLDGGGRGRPVRSLFDGSPVLVVPLRGLIGDQQSPGGLLLLTPALPEIAREVRWVADVLGQRLVRLSWYRRILRERTLLHSLINAVPDPILLTNAEGRMAIANSGAEALLASKEDESEGRRQAVALNNMLFSAALGRGAVKELEPERRELGLVDPTEGSDLLFELLSTVTSDPREGTGIVSVLRNVTDLRRATQAIEEGYGKLRLAEAAVRAERDRLDLIIDSVGDPILVTDPGGNLLLMNSPAERLFTLSAGASREEAARVRANDANFTSFVSNVFFGVADQRYRGGISLVDPQTGGVVPVEAVSGKILSGQGELIGVVTILHDRTEALERERLYARLERAKEELEEKIREATAELIRQNELLRRQAIELEQASALKSQFLANVSHELRTPLNAVLGYTSILLKGVTGALTEGQRDNLVRINSNARHLVSIINDILDISRIEAGRMPLRVSEFRLPQLVGEVTEELEPLILRSRLSVTTDLPPRLPAIRSDRQKVKQVLLNLLSNAIKFTPAGTVKVSAVYLRANRETWISITDTGIGIAGADQQRIFEDFRQADNSPTRQFGGTGLGLSIARRLARMLGGDIRVRSTLGQGSTFTLQLPVKAGDRSKEHSREY
jgi:PAS domain S-box-containing protein